jgi:hypothetical protein
MLQTLQYPAALLADRVYFTPADHALLAQDERSCHQRKTSFSTPLISFAYTAINGMRLCMLSSNVPYGLIWA